MVKKKGICKNCGEIAVGPDEICEECGFEQSSEEEAEEEFEQDSEGDSGEEDY